MTRDEIIEMARQAWISDKEAQLITEFDEAYLSCTYLTDLTAFAKLVYDRGWRDGYTSCDNDNKTLTSALIEDAVEEEREACAKVCEQRSDPLGYANLTAEVCAKAIRARGNHAI